MQKVVPALRVRSYEASYARALVVVDPDGNRLGFITLSNMNGKRE